MSCNGIYRTLIGRRGAGLKDKHTATTRHIYELFSC